MLIFHTTMDQGFHAGSGVSVLIFHITMDQGFPCQFFHTTMDQGLGFKFHTDFSHTRVGCFYSWQLIFLWLH